MSKQWITWQEYSKGYTMEDHLAHALRGTLPTIDRNVATYEQLKEQFNKVMAKKAVIAAMRKSKKKERAINSWIVGYTQTVLSHISTGASYA